MKTLLIAAAGLFAGLLVPLAPAGAADYAIERMQGDVYRFTAGNYHSVFMMTDAGIVATDPIDAATWLAQELEARFDFLLRYVIYSHNHIDHTYGGRTLDDEGVRFVAHRLARADLVHKRAETRLPELTFND